jgi:hypothetical protein
MQKDSITNTKNWLPLLLLLLNGLFKQKINSHYYYCYWMDYSNVIRKLILFRMDKSYFFTRFKEIEETDGWEKLFYV